MYTVLVYTYSHMHILASISLHILPHSSTSYTHLYHIHLLIYLLTQVILQAHPRPVSKLSRPGADRARVLQQHETDPGVPIRRLGLGADLFGGES